MTHNIHLTPEQCVEAAESARTEFQAHLTTCAHCAMQVAEMQRLMADVSLAAEVPEPSPLFWNHLSARVREAVDAEPAPMSWWRAQWRPLAAIAGVLGVIAIVAVMKAPMWSRDAAPVTVAALAETAPEETASESDAVWNMISDVASTMPADQVMDAGMRPGRAATDAAIESLSANERAALVKLLRAEMGASE